MHCKRHEINGRVVFALCDKELIGRVIKEGDAIIDLKKHGLFYIGDDAELLDGHFESINAVGRKSVNFLIKNKLADRKNVGYVNGVPHIQVYRI